MTATSLYLLLAIIAVLSVVVAVLLCCELRYEREVRDKVIIREICENAQLRDELRNVWRRVAGASDNSNKIIINYQ